MTACTVCLVLMGRIPDHSGPWAPTILVALVGFMLLGPYSYLAGAMSLDFGGKHGSATAAGIIDGFGYMAGWLSGDTVARIAVAFGWRSAFLCLRWFRSSRHWSRRCWQRISGIKKCSAPRVAVRVANRESWRPRGAG